MKKLITTLTILLTLTLTACHTTPHTRIVADHPTPLVDSTYTRTADPLTYTDLAYTEWKSPAVAPQPPKPHTVLIYMNGSDLESETGAGTADLAELCATRIDEAAANVVIFTGGAYRWHTPAISATECEISTLQNGKIASVAKVGDRDMGNAGTLAAFIKFARAAYPAERTSLILWDHGGGSIAGYGADEKFDNSALTLRELEYAFAKSGLAEAPLALLGFDACLMATVETAIIAAPYAELLVASESLEPGDGWDYTALRTLNDSTLDTASLAVAIADAYLAASLSSPEEISVSVTRTARAAGVMGALGSLAERCAADLSSGNNGGFAALTSARRGTKSFGESALDTSCDMVDIAHLAETLRPRYPTESENVFTALSAAVIYNAHNSDIALGGLSAYHVFGGAPDAHHTLPVYAALQMSDAYTRYQIAFADRLLRADALLYSPAPQHKTTLFGTRATLYKVAATHLGTLCATACTVNGERAEALVYRPNAAPQQLLGYRKSDGYLLQKGYEKFTDHDRVVIGE